MLAGGWERFGTVPGIFFVNSRSAPKARCAN
jgi:hypothetical protein